MIKIFSLNVSSHLNENHGKKNRSWFKVSRHQIIESFIDVLKISYCETRLTVAKIDCD